MSISRFDEMKHEFVCENAECRETFKQILRSLLNTNEVICPKCGAAKDIRESKRHGPLGKDFDAASELDKQASKEK